MHPDVIAATEAARAGAEVVRAGFTSQHEIRMKGAVDPVTAVDDAAEKAIFETLARLCPGEDFLGEESGGEGWDSERVWIVDPLDGTVNFIHRLPHVAVSVAVWERGEPVAGAVIDVMGGAEFTARSGEGAWLDAAPMTVSAQVDLGSSLIATGFPYDRRQRADAYAATLGAVLAQVQGIRRVGSAALDLAWTAAGRYDGYWEYGLGPWDAAAGLLLVREAGGRVSDHRGLPYHLSTSTIVATNGHIHGALADLVAAHLPEHLR